MATTTPATPTLATRRPTRFSAAFAGRERLDRASAAHLVRRTTVTAPAEVVDALVGRSVGEALERLAEEPPPALAPDGEWGRSVTEWIGTLCDPARGLRTRLAWFWHGVFTTNADAVEQSLVAAQVEVLHTHALGNVRDLLQRFVVDGALLQYLDGDGSAAWDPNENLARELMELFTVGRGHYGEDDVRAAARALAGWRVGDGAVTFDRQAAFAAPLIFLGVQDRWDTASVVDALCDHPATPRRLGGLLWADLVGSPPDGTTLSEIGDRFADLEIEPLVRWIVGTEAFAASPRQRPRRGFEWWAAVRQAITTAGGSPQPIADDRWALDGLGQVPFHPPSVAGWAADRRWTAPGSIGARLRHLWSIDPWQAFGDGEVDLQRVLWACGLDDLAPDRRASIVDAGAMPDLEPANRSHLVWLLALSTPEFQFS
ncbi:MAG: DUF1800 family protein [Acidimicrobiales bacterium]